MTDILTRDETPVMFRRARDEPGEIRRAWAELEATVGSLRGRKFFGTFDPATGAYRACTQLRDDDDPRLTGARGRHTAGWAVPACTPPGRAAGDL